MNKVAGSVYVLSSGYYAFRSGMQAGNFRGNVQPASSAMTIRNESRGWSLGCIKSIQKCVHTIPANRRNCNQTHNNSSR